MSTVPLLFDRDSMLEWFLQGHDPATVDQVETAGGRLGRNAYPAFVIALYREGLLRADVAAIVVPSAWSGAEFPSLQLEPDEWRQLFDLAGYTIDGVPSDRPNEPVRLWRGAIPEYRDGWSWTNDRDLAAWFAARLHNAGRGEVWTVEVPPGRLLARITEQRPGESEHVADVRGLTILADSVRTAEAP